MTLPRLELAVILGALLAHDVDFVVIGGVAAIAHGVRRTTLDADIVTVSSPANDERVAAVYAELGVRSVDESQWRDLDPTDPFDVARAGPMQVVTDAGRLDVVRHENFERLAATAIETTIAGHRVRIAGRDELIAMKLAAGRPRDLQDVADLTAGEGDAA